MTEIDLAAVTRRFEDVTAVDRISLGFPAGSFTALLGPSGCGKSTLLRLVAGFEAPDEGSIRLGGRLVADTTRQIPPEKRDVGIVFQSYALWPHMDVAANVAYPLKVRGVDRQAIAHRVAAVLEMVGLGGFAARRIEELSGGQRQRVGLARCLVADSKFILFDEPLANLDMHLRASMVDVFRDIHHRTGATIVYVTHDQAEALALADRVAVMDNGRLLQVAPPTEVYRSPADEKVARFVGRGSILAGEVDADAPVSVRVAGQSLAVRMTEPRAGAVKVLLRPEALSLAGTGLAATVMSSIYRGSVHEVRLRLEGGQEELVMDFPSAPSIGERVHVAVADAWVIPGA